VPNGIPAVSVGASTVSGMARTAKTSTSFRCTECGWQNAKWVGRCGECQAWGTVEQFGVPASAYARSAYARPSPVSTPAVPITLVQADSSCRRHTGVVELDRVLGGGLVPGAVLLLAGEPGVGKSTLLLEVAVNAARAGSTTLYVSGEESAAQVRMRAERTNGLDERLFIATVTDLGNVLTHLDEVRPDLLVVDSIQTTTHPEVEGIAGGVTQVRAVAAALVREAKERNLATVLVGHVTKDGSIAGPRALEHIVDVVLNFEGERHSSMRILRAVKNRFGPVDEIGCFDMHDDGIVEISDPSGLFLSRQDHAVCGTCVTVVMEGRRPVLTEIQSLVVASERPRVGVAGLDASRVNLTLAVLHQRAKLILFDHDVHLATVGGANVREPAADLATALAVASSLTGAIIPADVVAIGEIGLAGELRPVPHLERRLLEAARIGFTKAIIPAVIGSTASPRTPGMVTVDAPALTEALRLLGLGSGIAPIRHSAVAR
jgi:DNA repair protein RadA/Sms